MAQRLRLWWQIFTYNFGWSNYVDQLDGWIPRLSVSIPIVGYLILFNDSITKNLTFLDLTSGHSAFGLSGVARLKFLYLGLVLLGFGNILFRLKRPYVLWKSRDESAFVENCLKNFTLTTYLELHEKIRHSGFDAYTRHGKYYDSEWEAFYAHASGHSPGLPQISQRHQFGHWVEAREKYESLLRGILMETFFRENTQTRQAWLMICIAISSTGYLFLAVPSVDLFVKVLYSILIPLAG
jgi:hypothetical protein